MRQTKAGRNDAGGTEDVAQARKTEARSMPRCRAARRSETAPSPRAAMRCATTRPRARVIAPSHSDAERRSTAHRAFATAFSRRPGRGFCIGNRRKWLRSRDMARRDSEFFPPAFRDLAFLCSTPRKRRRKGPGPCHSAPPRPVSTKSDVKPRPDRGTLQRRNQPFTDTEPPSNPPRSHHA